MSQSDCTRWSGSHRKSDGRPIIDPGPHPRYAYRVLWEEAHGPLDPGVLLHHTCENAWCINIDHLAPLTRAEHALEHGKGGDWGQADKTHCPAGHAYNETNTYRYERKNGSVERQCKTCRAETKRRFRARRRAAETENPS